MSYQEYAHLGRGRSTMNDRRATSRSRSESMVRYSMYSEQFAPRDRTSTAAPAAQRSVSTERPYIPSHISFSTPRRSLATFSHSATPSTESGVSSTSTSSLSPSNSASQLGSQKISHKDRKSKRDSSNTAGGAKLTARSLAQLKDLEKNAGSVRRGARRPGLIDVPLPWRPYYLQRKILSAFFATFAACIVVAEALLDYSGQNAGLLSETATNLRYLLAIVPPAVLTLLSALWGRVEYQAKMSAPWLRLAKGPDSADRTLLLDYFSMVPPRDVFRAMKNGDTAVACASVIAILLKIVIIVSTGMISLNVLSNMEETVPITLTTQFVNNGSRLATIGTVPLLTMVGLQRDNLTFPDGTSNQFAFQEFTSDMPSDTEFQTTVAGFSGSVNCGQAQLTLNSIQSTRPGVVQFNTNISAEACSVTVPLVSQIFNVTGAANRTRTLTRMVHASCGNATDIASQRIVVFFGTASIDTKATLGGNNQAVNGSITNSQQIICRPSYAISQVDLVKNGSYIDSVALNASPQPETLSNVQPWDIAQAHFDSITGSVAASITDINSPYFPVSTFTDSVNVDAAMYLAFGIQGQQDDITGDTASTPGTYLDAVTLQSLVQNYYLQYSALIARQALMAPASIETTCVVYIGGDRLVVGTVAVQTVAVLLAIILLFNIVTICMVPGKGYLPRDPHSLLDVAALLSHSRPLLQALRGAGGADRTELRRRVKMHSYYTGVEPYDRGSAETAKGNFCIFSNMDEESSAAPQYTEPTSGWHHPFTLHPLQRVLMYLFLAGLIAGLEITLHISTTNGGFGTVDVGGFKHFAWTMIPALVVTGIAIFFAATDFHVRALTPFAQLTRPMGGSMATMTSSLLDRTSLMAVYESIKQKCWTVGGAAAAVSVATLLPIFAASLFTAMTIPVSSEVALITQDFFSNSTNPPAPLKNNIVSNCATCLDGMTLASLVLDGNLSYPDFTYEDLAFPTLAIIPLIGVNETDDLETTTTVPAVRSAMSCNFFSQHDIIVNLTTNYRIGSLANPLRINLPGEPSRGTTELLSSTFVLGTAQSNTSIAAITDNAMFGAAAYRPTQAADGSLVTHWVYTWGQLARANSNQTTVQTISAMACNETMQELDVTVTFDGATLDINPDLPLVRMENTVRPSDAALSTTLNYTNLINVTTTPNLLDSFFSSLVSSQYAIPLANLGSTSNSSVSGPGTQNNTVAVAILRQHGILRAQVVSAFNRRPTTASSKAVDVFPLDINGTVMGNATQLGFTGHLTSVSDGTRRLLQDAPTTRVLQALLGAILLFSILSWSTFPGPSNVLPRPITSIASVAALLADGNIFGFFSRGPEWQTPQDLAQPFRDGTTVTAGFTLGWARAPQRRRRDTLARQDAYNIWGRSASRSGSGDDHNSDSNYHAELFGINASRTGGWGGGENVGLGLQARVGYAQRGYVGNWGRRS